MNRWNAPNQFAVLYTCCSERVARAIVRDLYLTGSIEIDDLQPDYRPQLVEIGWGGVVVDMASTPGIVECGFPLSYPDQIGHRHTQPFAEAWHDWGAEGILCRSASIWRIAHEGWIGDHENWSELAIFVENAGRQPAVSRRRDDDGWLVAGDADGLL